MMIPVDNRLYCVCLERVTQPPTTQKHPTVVVRKAMDSSLEFPLNQPIHAGGESAMAGSNG